MIETEKKGSAWPWIAVPVAAVVVFFVLKECQQRLPPAEHAPAAVAGPETPTSPKPGEPAPAGEQPEAPLPAPESEQSPAPQ